MALGRRAGWTARLLMPCSERMVPRLLRVVGRLLRAMIGYCKASRHALPGRAEGPDLGARLESTHQWQRRTKGANVWAAPVCVHQRLPHLLLTHPAALRCRRRLAGLRLPTEPPRAPRGPTRALTPRHRGCHVLCAQHHMCKRWRLAGCAHGCVRGGRARGRLALAAGRERGH